MLKWFISNAKTFITYNSQEFSDLPCLDVSAKNSHLNKASHLYLSNLCDMLTYLLLVLIRLSLLIKKLLSGP